MAPMELWWRTANWLSTSVLRPALELGRPLPSFSQEETAIYGSLTVTGRHDSTRDARFLFRCFHDRHDHHQHHQTLPRPIVPGTDSSTTIGPPVAKKLTRKVKFRGMPVSDLYETIHVQWSGSESQISSDKHEALL